MFRQPLKTLYYFSLVLRSHARWLLSVVAGKYRSASVIVVLLCLIYAVVLQTENPLQLYAQESWTMISIGAWWIGLGFLSSFGLGTGLHTFVLYLGPFIASATLAATECSTTDFDKYGPNKFICTHKGTHAPSFLAVWQLIALEAFLWGAGTAIGELPPYFVARAARLAGEKLKESGGSSSGSDDDVEVDDLEESRSSVKGQNSSGGKKKKNPSYFDHAKRWVIAWLGRIGFVGILLFASIPNPLFDLAGLTCGHMLVPFVTFFMATLIGKAVIKVNLQSFFIIAVFNKSLLEALVTFIDSHLSFASVNARAMFDNMRKQYHRSPDETAVPTEEEGGKGILALWDVFLAGMIIYFVISIINSSVQEYLVNQDEEAIEKYRLEHEDTKTKNA